MINERQSRFINALKNIPEYDGWNDDEIKENVNEVMNSNDGNRKLNFVRALSVLPEYENWNDNENSDNVNEVFELNKLIGKGGKFRGVGTSGSWDDTVQAEYDKKQQKKVAAGQLKKAYKDLIYELEEFNINPSNIKNTLSQIESNLNIAGDMDIIDESGENIRLKSKIKI
jgi:hypothetical protein